MSVYRVRKTDLTELNLRKTSEASGVPEAARITASERVGMKQRKAAWAACRRTFLQVPEIGNRNPVLVSCEVHDRLDEIVRRGGGRMSVSGLMENLARHRGLVYVEEIDRGGGSQSFSVLFSRLCRVCRIGILCTAKMILMIGGHKLSDFVSAG